MNSHEDVLSFMELLDLDEDLIDARLKSIMIKDKYSNKDLVSAIQLLQYKHLINVQENLDCENDKECDFAAKLIQHVSDENVGNVCKIVASTLTLNTETILYKSEHLLQQVLPEIESTEVRESSDSPEPKTALLNLKISDSILEAVIKKGGKLTLPFLEIPVQNILLSTDEKLKIHFLTSTVPKLFEGITGFNVLDKIWDYIKQLEDDNGEVTLKVLSSLSDYYLPVADSKGKILYETEIVYQYEFWQKILYGLSSTDATLRKISIYLAKRALDSVIVLNKNICAKADNDTIIFEWDHSNKLNEKMLWDNFFILMDSLEEKQSNIVLPSLQLFGSLKRLGHWLNCAFNIGLKHDNTQVRLKCIQHRLETKLTSQSEAVVLLEALNDINIYDSPSECEELKKSVCTFISDRKIFVNIFISIPLIKWSPVPFYHISSIISEITFKDFMSEINGIDMTKLLIEIFKVPCNNVVLRKAVVVNIAQFVGSCCDGLHWNDYVKLYFVLQAELKHFDLEENPLNSLISKISIRNEEKVDFYQLIDYLHIDVCLLYLQNHPEDMALFMDVLLSKIKKVHDIVTRQYSDKRDCLKDVIYLTHLYKKSGTLTEHINIIVAKEYKTILHYLLSVLSDNTLMSFGEMSILLNGFSSMSNSINNLEAKEILLQLYKTSVLFLRDKALEYKSLSMFLVHVLSKNPILLANYKHEMIGLKDIITLTSIIKNKMTYGKLRNSVYEKSCEMLHTFLNNQECTINTHAKEIAEYIENVIDCGGYGCLKWCLKIMNAILPCLLQEENNKFDVAHFITRMWKEIEELKSNNQHNPCIKEFVNLITQDVLLKRSMYNNVIIIYCNKIIEVGAVKIAPLLYLIRKLNSIEVTADCGQIVYVLCEILLYSPVPRKDQRIMENLVVEILQQPKYGFNNQNTHIHFNYQIQYLSILALSKIKDRNILENIATFIKKRVDEAFRNKQRYHGHSQAHRLLLTTLQHSLLISVMRPESCREENVNWFVELLGKLPHQPSVRICLEWYIALHLVLKKSTLNEEVLEPMKDIPLTSQFMIFYWTVKHKILNKQCCNEEYEFVMDFLLSHTMGQMFNIRLHAQYLAVILHSIYKNDSMKYSYTIRVIERTFIESAKDKNFLKLQQDFFVNNFDVTENFTPSFIYYFLPRYCEINNNENVDLSYVKNIMKDINENISKWDFFKKYSISTESDEEVFSFSTAKNSKGQVVDDVEALGTIQKKYIPWKNMSDVNVYESGKKKESSKRSSRLIVVASLIDKLPNLGGMARTGEVLGVETYVVDSLRHLQDRQFQGLSVSAERWIDVEEVRPGAPLKEYLARRKAEGYCVVAAEQTSTSCQLQSFKFPRKTLLLLGHEKEGIPCDLLPMMDHCVEIPQQGFVRSLNVHVTAAIFIWEYTRQNIL